jgi:hypothetical protein
MVIRAIFAVFVAASTATACARPAPAPKRGVIINDDCPQRPASWPNSKMRTSSGRKDSTLEPNTGALFINVRGDSLNPMVGNAQIRLQNAEIRRDTAVRDSALRITVPAGRYYFRARRIGSQMLQDSINVRSGYVDTVRAILGREVVCSVILT